MESKSLKRFGLTEGESRVYLALLRIGKSTIGDIIKEARVSNSKVYDILDRLNKKGLIGVVNENNRKSFEAKSPEMLKQNLNEQEEEINHKKEELNSLLPSLNEIFNSHEVMQEAEILKDTKGIKTFVERLLEHAKKGETIYILGSSSQTSDMLEQYLLDWQKRRIAKGVNAKILYTQDAINPAKARAKLKLTEVRLLPKEIATPVAIDISNEEVGTLVFGNNPLCFSIRSKEIAENYKKYFNFLWKLSKKSPLKSF